MEKLGLEPKLMICKIIVLPIKLFSLQRKIFYNRYINLTHKGFEPLSKH